MAASRPSLLKRAVRRLIRPHGSVVRLGEFVTFRPEGFVEAKDPPPFPGEPHLNEALKHLNAAKEKVSTDTPGALAELQAVADTLAHAIHNKGTYQGIARQFTSCGGPR